MRRLRADSLGALGREPDELQLAESVGRPEPPSGFRAVPPPAVPERSPGYRSNNVSVAYAWLHIARVVEARIVEAWNLNAAVDWAPPPHVD